jgi:hypothetical protein
MGYGGIGRNWFTAACTGTWSTSAPSTSNLLIRQSHATKLFLLIVGDQQEEKAIIPSNFFKLTVLSATTTITKVCNSYQNLSVIALFLNSIQ